MTSVVYFMQMGRSGPVKIGYTANLEKRRKLISQGLPETPYVLATLPGGRPLEQRLHKALSEYRMRLEWFRPEKELLALTILANAKGLAPVERWLESKEAKAFVARSLSLPETDDFAADIHNLTAIAFKLSAQRFGYSGLSGALEIPVGTLKGYACGRVNPPAVAVLNLSIIDPGACLGLWQRTGSVPDWVAQPALENARDAIEAQLAKLRAVAA